MKRTHRSEFRVRVEVKASKPADLGLGNLPGQIVTPTTGESRTA